MDNLQKTPSWSRDYITSIRLNWVKDYKCMKSCKITNILLSPYDGWVRGRQEIPLTLRGPSVPKGDSSDIIKYNISISLGDE